MKFAIIAAGEGSRLAQEGVNVPKPLVKIKDEALIDRLIRIFMMNELSSYLGNTPFVLTTVDTIFREDEFSQYIAAFRQLPGHYQGLMGVTDFIDDEKPLYVGTDEQLNITGFFDSKQDCNYISGGIYGLTYPSIVTLKQCIQRGESRMRNFQRGLIRDGLALKAYPFSKVLDIDHAGDIKKAEDFLNG